MNAYQEKWIAVLNNAQVKDWKVSAAGDDIMIDLPSSQHLNTIRENLPDVMATMALDITLPPERLKIIMRHGGERHEYVINPTEADLNTGR